MTPSQRTVRPGLAHCSASADAHGRQRAGRKGGVRACARARDEIPHRLRRALSARRSSRGAVSASPWPTPNGALGVGREPSRLAAGRPEPATRRLHPRRPARPSPAPVLAVSRPERCCTEAPERRQVGPRVHIGALRRRAGRGRSDRAARGRRRRGAAEAPRPSAARALRQQAPAWPQCPPLPSFGAAFPGISGEWRCRSPGLSRKFPGKNPGRRSGLSDPRSGVGPAPERRDRDPRGRSPPTSRAGHPLIKHRSHTGVTLAGQRQPLPRACSGRRRYRRPPVHGPAVTPRDGAERQVGVWAGRSQGGALKAAIAAAVADSSCQG